MASPSVLRVVTRSSPMALAQVERLCGLLAQSSPGLQVDVVEPLVVVDVPVVGGRQDR
jgi:hydroxymethylbilane synthase